MGFQGLYETESDHNTLEGERFAYVGCVHGADDRLSEQLVQLAETQPPDHLIFMGDLTGSLEMEELKRRFYNLVQNSSKPLLARNPDLADEQLLNYSENPPPQEAATLRDGYKALYSYQLYLEGTSPDAIKENLAALPDTQIANAIRYISSLPYYGDFVAALSAQVRMGVLRSLESSARQILRTLDSFRERGTGITMVGGNWDLKYSGVYPIAGKDIPIFKTMDFFEKHGISCVEQLDVLETESAFHILIAYDALLDFESIPEAHLNEIEQRLIQARAQGKAIIMIGHGEPNWKMHTLHIPNPPPNPRDRDITLRNFGRLISRFKPDQVAYPHQHNRIVDEMRNEIGLNVKYVLERNADGDGVHLVEDPGQIGVCDDQTLVTYVPLRHIAHGIFSRKDGQRVFDRSQAPIRVLDR